MGLDLSGTRGGYFRWSNSGWQEMLKRGEDAGWIPIGTGPPRGIFKADWPGTYFSNDGQRFYARDARRLAEALESSLTELPTDEAKEYRKFIRFCRRGSFRLW